MKWASALSEQTKLDKAVAEVASLVKTQLRGDPVDFATLFVSQNFSDHYAEAAVALSDRLGTGVLIGCSAGGVIGDGREVESRPAVSLTAACLPGVQIHPFVAREEDLPDMDASPRAWETLVGVKASENPHFVILADPFSIQCDNLLRGLDYAFPNAAKVGGLASGASRPNMNALYLNNQCFHSGAVGVALRGNLALDTLVAQGCKPIGGPLRVTDCEENVLLGLNNQPPLHALQEMIQKLTPHDRELVRHSLFLGLVIDPRKEKLTRGDFLIRNIIGADTDNGTLAIGAPLRVGQTVQFHLRDAQTSADDLRRHLHETLQKNKASGALLFSCVGRGMNLYGTPHHDSRLFLQNMGPVPLGGFFCNGEIGPVGGTTHLHGYTSCFGLFRPKTPTEAKHG